MKQEDYIQILEQYAEIKFNKAATTSGEVISRIVGDVIEREGQKIAISHTNNPTWHIGIKKLKPIVKACEDCGKMVKDRKVFINVYAYPQPHRRKNCHSCKKTQDPITKEFTISTVTAQVYFTAYLNKRDK